MALMDNIIPIAALWGAILSTVMLALKIIENWIKVKVNSRNYCIGEDDGPVDEYYSIKAINIGNKPVTMAYAYIEVYPGIYRRVLSIFKIRQSNMPRTGWHTSIDGKQIFFGQCIEVEFKFPDDLIPIVTPKNIGTKKKVIGVFVDQIGNVYKSKPFEID
jgi:hypothetical protein